MTDLIKKIEELKKEKDAVILAHYYVNDEVQQVADYIGDSYNLSKLATEVPQQTICFAGVNFMGESAKILNPEKTVLLPEPEADCPMAHMAQISAIKKIKAEHEDLAVVCYINSTAELKQYADVCVTSSNALKIVKALPNKNIYFIPDQNLGRYIAQQVPEKHFIFNDGHCPIHTRITAEAVRKAKAQRPDAEVLAHPECTADVLALADYIGSTSGIIDQAAKSSAEEFLICTEIGVFYELKRQNPDKAFYPVMDCQICEDMKKITLEKIADCLETGSSAVTLSEQERTAANAPLLQMLALAK